MGNGWLGWIRRGRCRAPVAVSVGALGVSALLSVSGCAVPLVDLSSGRPDGGHASGGAFDQSAPATTTTMAVTEQTTAPGAEPTATSDSPAAAPTGAVDSAVARQILDARTDPLSYDDYGYADLGFCPLDESGVAFGKIFADIRPVVFASAADQPVATDAYLFSVSLGAQIGCHRTAPGDEAAIGLVAMAAPADIGRYIDSFTGEADGVAPELTRGESSDSDGATVHRFCVHYPDEPEADFCEVDWVDANLLLGAYVAGPDAARVDQALLGDRLLPQIPNLVAGLAASDEIWSPTA